MPTAFPRATLESRMRTAVKTITPYMLAAVLFTLGASSLHAAERAGVPQEKRGFKLRLPENPSAYVQEMFKEVSKMGEVNKVRKDTEKYFPALRDWAANGVPDFGRAHSRDGLSRCEQCC